MTKAKKILSIFGKKYRIYWIIAVIILGIAGFIFFRNGKKTETLVVHPGDFLQQVAVSGKIIATESISLSFEQSGQVKGVYVKEGDRVKSGQLLANQDTLQLSAQLAETRAGIELQEAKLNQLLAGASAEDIKISENKVRSAEQDLDNAYDNALTDLDSAFNSISNAHNTVFYIQNTYFSGADQQGVKVQNSRSEIQQIVVGAEKYLADAKNNADDQSINSAIDKIILDLNKVYGHLILVRSICEEGVYYSRVSATDKASLDTQKTNINAALSNIKSAKQDILSYQIDLELAKDDLALKKAPVRQSDIAVFQAQIDQAKASEQNILAQLSKKQVRAPIEGIVTKVNAKLGSIIAANETAVSIISSDPLQIESYLPEIYVSLVEIGDAASLTLDAYGNNIFFEAKVISIDPAETIREGVPTYRTKFQLLSIDERVKSGMSANVVITTDKKYNVISVPQGIIISWDGRKFVRVQEGKTIIEKEVQTGIISSLGQIEIISGLNNGDVVVIK